MIRHSTAELNWLRCYAADNEHRTRKLPAPRDPFWLERIVFPWIMIAVVVAAEYLL